MTPEQLARQNRIEAAFLIVGFVWIGFVVGAFAL